VGLIRRRCGSTNDADCSPPGRTDGGTRRYTDDDLAGLERISELVARGINIAGITQILHLEHRNSELESDNSDLESENARLRSKQPTRRRRTPNQ
jgi:MerR family transcriptional regulator, heat shock protein HspR